MADQELDKAMTMADKDPNAAATMEDQKQDSASIVTHQEPNKASPLTDDGAEWSEALTHQEQGQLPPGAYQEPEHATITEYLRHDKGTMTEDEDSDSSTIILDQERCQAQSQLLAVARTIIQNHENDRATNTVGQEQGPANAVADQPGDTAGEQASTISEQERGQQNNQEQSQLPDEERQYWPNLPLPHDTIHSMDPNIPDR